MAECKGKVNGTRSPGHGAESLSRGSVASLGTAIVTVTKQTQGSCLAAVLNTVSIIQKHTGIPWRLFLS